MKISLVIISTLLILSVIVPVLLFIVNGAKNTSNIKKQINKLIKDNGITFSQKEIWRKSFIGLSNDYKTITYIHFKENNPFITNIALADVKQCLIIKNATKSDNKVSGLKNLDLEFSFKSSSKPNIYLNFFNVDNDLTEDFEMQRIEKWHTLILDAHPHVQIAKMAS